MEFKTVEQDLKPILEEIEITRSDDMRLYTYYVQKKGADIGKVLYNREYRLKNGLASYETVSRVRRKLQAQYRDLRPSKDFLEGRKKAEAEYKKYARERGRKA